MRYAKPIIGGLAALALMFLIVRQVTQAVRHTFMPPAGLAQLVRASSQT